MTNHSNSRETDVKRRDLAAALLGMVGGAMLLEGCSEQQATSSDPMDLLQQAASGTGVLWVDSVLGATPPNARTGDLNNPSSALGNNTVVIAKGCVVPGDGGGGVFLWNAAGTKTGTGTCTTGSAACLIDDGGTVIVPGKNKGDAAMGGCWQRIWTGPLNVRWFGARGDGVTNDAVAIQNAIDAASIWEATFSNWVGSSVYMPAGKYKLTQQLKLYARGLRFYGDGWRTMLLPAANVSALRIGDARLPPAGNPQIVNPYGGQFDISNFTVEGSYISATGIECYQAVQSRLANLYVHQCGVSSDPVVTTNANGITLDNHLASPPGNNDGCVIENCCVNNNKQYGIEFKPGPDNNNININWCQVQANEYAGLLIRGSCNMVRGGDYSYNGGYYRGSTHPTAVPGHDPAILLSLHTDATPSVGNQILHVYCDNGTYGLVRNMGKAHQNIIQATYPQGASQGPNYVTAVAANNSDTVFGPSTDGDNWAGLAITNSTSQRAVRIKPAAGNDVHVASVYADGDADTQLWLYGKGGVVLGRQASPLLAHLSAAYPISGWGSVPANGVTTFVVGAPNGADTKAKPGDIANASFNPPLPTGIFIRNVEVRTTSQVSITVQNTTATAFVPTGTVRVQVFAY